MTFKILTQVFHILREITMKLQMQANDVVYAYKQVSSVASILKSMRQDSKSEFRRVFADTTKLGQQLDGATLSLAGQELLATRCTEAIQRHPVQRITFESLCSMNYSLT